MGTQKVSSEFLQIVVEPFCSRETAGFRLNPWIAPAFFHGRRRVMAE